ncbi:hypothetical protein [Cellulomonas iranensis]|uniref:hypothetical protein n=1 Tax=Cellulomonas iranensis TaxID=76862 RepID=UPI0013D35091|nr:hypothetical protein [Cellulomonas iranensis]
MSAVAASGEIDWTETDEARHNRRAKAALLAEAAREFDLGADDLAVGTGNRLRVRRHAGIDAASEKTWAEAALILADDPPRPTAPAARPCWHCGARDGVRAYLNGPCCPRHTPAALAGHHEPTPDPSTTLAALRERAAIAAAAHQAPTTTTVVDERAVTSSKRRSAHHVHQAMKAAALARGRTTRGRR